MKSICVYCGSSMGNNPAMKEVAAELGQELAERQVSLVYGGASIGLMGVLADACLAKGGRVIGVIPGFLDTVEITHKGVTEIIRTESMHQRKTEMAERAEGFIAMPGGFGTLEELAEILTWGQLGLVQKPIGILNVNGYYDPLMIFMDHMLKNELIREDHLSLFVIRDNVKELLEDMESFEVSKTDHRQKLGLT
ncbi:Rossman fold protein, TIGR00730 family [Reichenbachiella sp. 5M10]|uniref:LOG family protein n=1 Tax=Reichenbachiella sp. 5M10 TaxID=1889772 RepID=UPI000C145462|nr:TIGR00730 family Rossman fold protein [Reichenbachiella sp. 5M10]PIB36710.1 Rossman fold protein, TIGR00730 family [Reichenbachiella sp. 5M10]